CTSLLEYEGDVRQSILRYKFHGLSFYSSVYTELMSDILQTDEYACDIVTWVPLSKARLRKRGYDQARLLAEGFAQKKKLPCIPLLKKVRNAAPQSGTRTREERSTNIRNAYQVPAGTEMNGTVVLLLDDIVTTGATLSECARVLKSAGAKQVKALTLARTDLKKVRKPEWRYHDSI
ncbi:MAG: ComF family protein, partial [Oscillospiraceae bacterium]|nr:ComF family protein [Oscillospiraceae bacterium]